MSDAALRAWCAGEQECNYGEHDLAASRREVGVPAICSQCNGTNKIAIDPTEWAEGLPPLVLAANERECDYREHDLAASRQEVGVPATCSQCQGTGKVALVERPLLRVGLALGWAALAAMKPRGAAGWTGKSARIFAALRAARAWVDDPSEERLEAWKSACSRLKLAGDNWVPCTSLIEDPKPEVQARLTLAAAVKILGVPAAGRVVIEEVERWAA